MGGTKKQHTQRKKRKVCSHLTDISLGFAGRGRNDFGALGQNFCLLIPEVDIGVQYQRRIAGEVTETFTGDVTSSEDGGVVHDGAVLLLLLLLLVVVVVVVVVDDVLVVLLVVLHPPFTGMILT